MIYIYHICSFLSLKNCETNRRDPPCIGLAGDIMSPFFTVNSWHVSRCILFITVPWVACRFFTIPSPSLWCSPPSVWWRATWGQLRSGNCATPAAQVQLRSHPAQWKLGTMLKGLVLMLIFTHKNASVCVCVPYVYVSFMYSPHADTHTHMYIYIYIYVYYAYMYNYML